MACGLKLPDALSQLVDGSVLWLNSEQITCVCLRIPAPLGGSGDDPAEYIEPAEILGGVVSHVRTLPSRSDTATATSGPLGGRTPLGGCWTHEQ